MTADKGIRWEQRFSNYRKTVKKLSEAIEFVTKENGEKIESVLDEIIKDGLIQRFEYTFEMAWNVMKDYALYQGNSEIAGSRDAIQYAYSTNLITNGDM